jgi:hypothetical protein
MANYNAADYCVDDHPNLEVHPRSPCSKEWNFPVEFCPKLFRLLIFRTQPIALCPPAFASTHFHFGLDLLFTYLDIKSA